MGLRKIVSTPGTRARPGCTTSRAVCLHRPAQVDRKPVPDVRSCHLYMGEAPCGSSLRKASGVQKSRSDSCGPRSRPAIEGILLHGHRIGPGGRSPRHAGAACSVRAWAQFRIRSSPPGPSRCTGLSPLGSRVSSRMGPSSPRNGTIAHRPAQFGHPEQAGHEQGMPGEVASSEESGAAQR